MNDLCADIGFQSLHKHGEELCGDHIELIQSDDNATIVVLADGLGSGVKANILATLTAKIISTMMARGLKLEDCVETIAASLPVCSVRDVAYSTFTILCIRDHESAEIIQYDNPPVLLIREGKRIEYPSAELMIEGKRILRSVIDLQENDILIAMSDGCVHAGKGGTMNFSWDVGDIASFMETFYHVGFSAKTLNTILLDECLKLYGGHADDDATACTIRIRKRAQMNLLIGPPSNRDDCGKMMSLFFSKEGKCIVCGGTTAALAAEHLGKEVVPVPEFPDKAIPPISRIEGVDLVTEGTITVNKVLSYAQDYLADNRTYNVWGYKKDGASRIARMLFEEATDINFYVGKAVNPAHQELDLPISFQSKMQLVDALADCLREMGKQIKVSYF
ncbi:MAG: SpoIIE family protein phosphatase [Eubacteriales bacterium]|nr:SpoIIE family protein phosphatase [Eubacteriales bacterium]